MFTRASGKPCAHVKANVGEKKISLSSGSLFRHRFSVCEENFSKAMLIFSLTHLLHLNVVRSALLSLK